MRNILNIVLGFAVAVSVLALSSGGYFSLTSANEHSEVNRYSAETPDHSALSAFIRMWNSVNNDFVARIGPRKVASELWVNASAYTSRVQETDDTPFITANGSRVRWGTVASNFLPFGTEIRIPDYFGSKIFTVEDRMNKRFYHMIDIWHDDLDEAYEFGSKRVRMQILKRR